MALQLRHGERDVGQAEALQLAADPVGPYGIVLECVHARVARPCRDTEQDGGEAGAAFQDRPSRCGVAQHGADEFRRGDVRRVVPAVDQIVQERMRGGLSE